MKLFSNFGSTEALLKIRPHQHSSWNPVPQKLFSQFGSRHNLPKIRLHRSSYENSALHKFLSKPVPRWVLVRSWSADRKSTSDWKRLDVFSYTKIKHILFTYYITYYILENSNTRQRIEVGAQNSELHVLGARVLITKYSGHSFGKIIPTHLDRKANA